MPEKETLRRARADKRAGKSASTQAGEFVREEIHHVREGKHGAQSTKQAIAIGLSKARRAGVKLGKEPAKTTHARKGQGGRKAASHAALSRQAKSVARKRSAASRSAAAKKAAATRRRSRASA